MEDIEIIGLFYERSDDAINELSRKYGKLCRGIALNILGDARDAEECVNDAYLAFWETVPPQNPQVPLSYLCRIVRNIAINRQKENAAQKRRGNYDLCLEELGDVLGTGTVDEAIDQTELARGINEFVSGLNEKDRRLFIRRFWYLDSYEDISAAYGIAQGALRVRLSRIKKKLKEYLTERGISI